MSDEYNLNVEASALFKEIQKENDFYRSIISNNSFYIIKTDLEGKYTYLNPYFCKRLNVSSEEWIGRDSLGLIIPEDRQACIDIIIACFAAPLRSHWVMLRKPVTDGIMFTQWEFRILFDDLGAPFEFLCIGHDVTSLVIQQFHERTQLLIKQEEAVKSINNALLVLNNELEERVIIRTKALAESESRFRNMMETIPQIAWTNTLAGRFTFYNQRWYDYTGLKPRQSNIWGWKRTIHPDDLRLTRDKFRQSKKNYNGGEFEARFKNAAGVYRWHLTRVMPITNDDRDEESLWVGTATDIHDLKLLQQQKDDFINIASHELKTPLTAMKIALQLLIEMKDNPSHKMLPRLIDQANKSLNHITALVDNILNASSFNESMVQVNSNPVNIFSVIEESCKYLPLKGANRVTVEGNQGLLVCADPVKVSQVITNLVNNAIKYAPDSLLIEIRIERAGDKAKISVTDFGVGIEADKLDYLFDRYYQVRANEGQGSSLGLGLYICAEIIRKHRGEIGVTSEVGVGSTFWFTLPVAVGMCI